MVVIITKKNYKPQSRNVRLNVVVTFTTLHSRSHRFPMTLQIYVNIISLSTVRTAIMSDADIDLLIIHRRHHHHHWKNSLL
jgi:hypothetical protein